MSRDSRRDRSWPQVFRRAELLYKEDGSPREKCKISSFRTFFGSHRWFCGYHGRLTPIQASPSYDKLIGCPAGVLISSSYADSS
jgi:hypothetical protein